MTVTEPHPPATEVAPPILKRRRGLRATRTPPTARPARFEPGKAGEARKRNPVWLAGGLLLVLVCALGGALLFSSSDERVSVLIAAEDLAPGVPVGRRSFVVAEVAAGSAVASIGPDLVDSLTGRMPAGPIPKGTMINDGLLVDSVPLDAGEMVVGVALDPGEVPTRSVEIGTAVELMVVPLKQIAASPGQQTSSAQEIGRGVVWASESLDTGQVFLSIRVDDEVGRTASAASADDRLRVAVIGDDK